MNNLKDRIFKSADIYKELITFLVLFFISYFLASYFDIFEFVHVTIIQNEPWEIDEVIGVCAIWFFFVFVFLLHRSIRLKNEIREKKQILDDLRNRARQSEIVAKLGQIPITQELSVFMDTAANSVAEGLEVEYCQILRLLPDGEHLLLVAGVGWKDGSVGNTVISSDADSQSAYTLSSKHPVIVKNLQTEERFSESALLHDHGVLSGISTTIKCNNKISGVIGAHTKRQRNFTQDNINFLQSVSNIIAHRIDQEIANSKIKNNIEVLYKKSKYEAVISAVTRNLLQTTNLLEVLENVTESLSKNMDMAEHISIFIIEGEDAVLKTSKGLPVWFVKKLAKIPYPKGYTWKVLKDNKPRNCPDVDQDEYIGPSGRQIGPKSYLSVPFQHQGKVLGCINLHSFEKNAFSDDELKLLEIVAQQIESAVGNAKQAEVLEESENKYRTIVEHSYDMIIEVDADSKFLFANRNHKEYLGFESEDLIGKTIFDFIHPEDRIHVISSFMHAMNTNTASAEVIFRYKHKDGSWRWLNSIGKPFKTANGETRGVITSRDITDRKLEEEKRREIEERYRALVEYSHDLIVEINTKGEFLFVNKNHKNQLGYDPEELIGTSIFDNIHPEDKNAVLNKLIAGQQSFSSAGAQLLRYKHKNGEWRWLQSMGTPFETSSGETRAVIYSSDITERRKMEEELLKSQKMESLSLLAGGIAHDFNNLLTIILGNISLARTKADPHGDMSKKLLEAENAIQRATGLTQQLLTFSKSHEPNLQVMTIHEMLKDSTKFALRGSNVECKFSIKEDLLPVEIDEGQINQVINNLIINAQQAMSEGGLIKVGARNIVLEKGNTLNLPQGEYVQIYIKDKGCGIPKKHLQKIFDPFFTTKERGSGLGIASSFSIIKQHRGHMTVSSRVNKGTTFYIYLPAFTSSLPILEDQQNNLIRGKGNLLIMDDEQTIRDILSEMTILLGYKPKLAANSSEAIKIYKESIESGDRLDAVILDLTIPGDIGGVQTLEKLLEIDKDIKAIVSSGYSENGNMSNYEKYGFKACMPKPYNIHSVSKILSDLIMSQEH